MGSLVVREGTGGLKPLTDRDKREIAVTARKVLAADRHPEATFSAAGFAAAAGGGEISGTLTLAGRSRPIRLQVSESGSGSYQATASVVQTQFGIKPYSGFLGALKVRDAVEVRAEVALPDGGETRMTSPGRARRRAAVARRRQVSALFERREQPVRELAGQAAAVAAACHDMAIRFHRGGKLVVFGVGGASTDAQHVAVEFVHPVIVGKRALPAISLTTDIATVTGIAAGEGMAAIFSHQLGCLAEPSDIALGISAGARRSQRARGPGDST